MADITLGVAFIGNSLAGTLRGGRGGAEDDVGVVPPKFRPRLAMKKGGVSTYSSTSSGEETYNHSIKTYILVCHQSN